MQGHTATKMKVTTGCEIEREDFLRNGNHKSEQEIIYKLLLLFKSRTIVEVIYSY